MAIKTVGAEPVLADYTPEVYSPKIKEIMRDNTVLLRLCNRDYEGSFKGKGDKIIIRKDASIATQEYISGAKLNYQRPETDSETHEITRARYYAFRVNSIKQMLSDIPAFASRWTRTGGLQLAEDMEREFFGDIGPRCHSANQGNTAGLRSASYKLGTALAPVVAYKTATEVAASSETYKNTVIDLIAEAAVALAEQPGGAGLNPWMVIPTRMALYIQTSELKNASLSGDSVSTLRKKAVTSIGNIAGFDIFTSNLTPITSAGVNDVFFGDQSGISFADEIAITEMLPDADDFGNLHRSLSVYDWFPILPERFGQIKVKFA